MDRCLKKIKTRKRTTVFALIPERRQRWPAIADLVLEEPNDKASLPSACSAHNNRLVRTPETARHVS